MPSTAYVQVYLLSFMDFVEGEILAFDKPYRWTSFDVVGKARWLLCKKLGVKKLKVGHSGTLDPLATGVVVVCTGKKTKLIDQLQAHQKEYVATLQLGATTPSFDLEKEVDATYPTNHITAELIQEVIPTFEGEQWQVPPMFSAVKVDGKRAYNVAVNLKAAYETECREVVREFEKRMLLFVIDDEWKEHLRQLDELKQSVQNASYEQKDPLLIYKLESFNIFKQMLDRFNRRAIAILLRGQIPTRDPQEVRQAHAQQRHDYSRYRTQKDAVARAAAASGQAAAANHDTRAQQRPEPLRVEKKPRPNDPCPCGSGKKYKQCHGKMEA